MTPSNSESGFFGFDNASAIATSADPFPVNFDDAWQWLGFSRKDNAKQSLLNAGFSEGQDFRSFLINQEREIGATQIEEIRLSVECFKSWAMMAKTARGREVRRYYIECEKMVKAQLNDPKLLLEREKTKQERERTEQLKIANQAKLAQIQLAHDLKLAEIDYRRQKPNSQSVTATSNKGKSEDPLEKIVDLARRYPHISARDVAQRILSLKRVHPEEIRAMFERLAHEGKGEVFGQGTRKYFRVSR